MKSIYAQAVVMLPASDIDHHESDLYLRKTPASEKLVAQYSYRNIVTTFRCAIEHDVWYEIPFAYDPFWEERRRSNVRL